MNSPAMREHICGVYFFASSSSEQFVLIIIFRPFTRRVFTRV